MNSSGNDVPSIFQGKKFWLSTLLPMKDHFKALVTNNGGKVVYLEKDADILIADPIKKNRAPAGACSYKLIEDSVKNGALQLEDRFLIAPKIGETTPRQAGSSIPTRKHRVPFTPQDDAILAKWVLSHPDARTGNILYQELETINSRHTWQSWRNRWGKDLSRRPMTRLKEIASSAKDLQIPGADNDQEARISATGVREETEAKPEPSPGAQTGQEPEDAPGQDEAVRDEDEEDRYRIALEQFTADIKAFSQQRGIDIELRPVVGGRTIKLFDLARAAATYQDESSENIDWDQVAAELGFGEGPSDVAMLLAVHYKNSLESFFDAMAQHDDDDDDDDKDKDNNNNNGNVPQAEEEEDDDEDAFETAPQGLVRDSPALTSPGSRKRTVYSEPPSTRNSKRKRLSEIPSTPDDALRVTLRQQNTPSATKRQLFPNAEVKDSQDDTQATLSGPGRTRVEVQIRTPRRATLDTQKTSLDVTPSQQLMEEAQALTSPAVPSPVAFPNSSPAPQRHRLPDSNSTPRPKKAKRRTLPASFRASTLEQPQRYSDDSDNPFETPDIMDLSNTVPNPTHSRRHTPDLQTIQGWVEHYQSLGYSHSVVVQALEATTITPGGPATHAMEALRSGHPLPPNHEGVWTDRDDASLRQVLAAGISGPLDRRPVDDHDRRSLRTASKELSRLQFKHGGNAITLRAQFLEAVDRQDLDQE
ncbi:telomeric repeat-binding factor 2-interacting protein 1 [Geosmithia morbida]|uniref:DNA-binding protein RAP1 n=1 Tax=Geosmithia morbida TaxID=1094350 RepID=A0A9P4YV06_9HYPO|nr:telomeric repeat-binding factor 2-interacting protein 1 [Geosmithia morbida]KAF4122188.1 telomeric repeat-binding factor 2-interacting protein 1 [Geosmithia morbida]